MIAIETAYQIARNWVDAWNRHDLDAIMEHYADSVEFWSPLVIKRLGLASGKLEGKDQLRSYFAQGLGANSELHFKLLQVLVGVDSVTIYYRRQNGIESAEMIVLDENRRVVMARVHYSEPL